MTDTEVDMTLVNHPSHYTSHPSGVELILITEDMNCPNLANVVKYIGRFLYKGTPLLDLEKGAFYIKRERERRDRRVNEFGSFYIFGNLEEPWNPVHARFYRYIDAEPNHAVKRALVAAWNLDQMDWNRNTDASNLQQECLNAINVLIRQFKIEAANEEVQAEVNQEFAPEPENADKLDVMFDGQPWTATAKDVVDDDLINSGDLLILEDGGVQYSTAIEGIRRTRGGIVWIATRDDDEHRFKPSDSVVWVKAA